MSVCRIDDLGAMLVDIDATGTGSSGTCSATAALPMCVPETMKALGPKSAWYAGADELPTAEPVQSCVASEYGGGISKLRGS